MIAASGLVKRFGSRQVLRGLDLEVEAGGRLALFGANGAGKTTLLRILAGLSRPDGGTVRTGPGGHGDGGPDRRRIGYAGHQTLLYPHLTGRENLAFHARLFGLPRTRERVDHVLDRLGLRGRGDDPLRAYSRGMSQRLALGRAILHDPDILLLDEPFSGLDPLAADTLRSILEELHRDGRTIVMTSHDLAGGLRLADSVAILHNGTIGLAAGAADREPGWFEAEYRRLLESGSGG